MTYEHLTKMIRKKIAFYNTQAEYILKAIETGRIIKRNVSACNEEALTLKRVASDLQDMLYPDKC